jgi:hypothetical protein
VPLCEIAATIGRGTNLPVRSIPEDQTAGYFGFLITLDNPTSNAITREVLGWEPAHPVLIADYDEGHYFAWSHTPVGGPKTGLYVRFSARRPRSAGGGAVGDGDLVAAGQGGDEAGFAVGGAVEPFGGSQRSRGR